MASKLNFGHYQAEGVVVW